MITHIRTIPKNNSSVSIPLETSRVSASRIPLIDMLRGYALLGIFLVRMVEVYSGWTTEQATTLSTERTDILLHQLIAFFAIGKFRALFSLLFGLSFYLQLKKFEEKGVSFTQNFLKRLAVLFLFGMLHAYLLWSGDILRWYAFAGLLLIPLYKLPTRALFIVGILLVILPSIGEELYHKLSMVTTTADPKEALAVQTLTSTHSYWVMLKANSIIVNAEWLHLVANLSHILVITGYFLLGIWAGRLELYVPGNWKNRYQHHTLEVWQSLIATTLILATITTAGIIGMLIYTGLPVKTLVMGQNGILKAFIYHGKTPLLVLMHIAGIYMLSQVAFIQKKLSILAYAGRMTLSNYILQSMIGIGIFYGVGLGLWEKIGPTYSVTLTIGLFILQVAGSYVYLKFFKSGPLEYIWRILIK